MKDIIRKIDNDDSKAGEIDASEVNSQFSETENAIRPYMDLNEEDETQLSKSINSASKSLFYEDVGMKNAIELYRNDNLLTIETLEDKSVFFFKPRFTTNGPTTLQVGDLSIKKIVTNYYNSFNSKRLEIEDNKKNQADGELTPTQKRILSDFVFDLPNFTKGDVELDAAKYKGGQMSNENNLPYRLARLLYDFDKENTYNIDTLILDLNTLKEMIVSNILHMKTGGPRNDKHLTNVITIFKNIAIEVDYLLSKFVFNENKHANVLSKDSIYITVFDKIRDVFVATEISSDFIKRQYDNFVASQNMTDETDNNQLAKAVNESTKKIGYAQYIDGVFFSSQYHPQQEAQRVLDFFILF